MSLLLLFAHRSFENSRLHSALADAAQKLQGLEFVDLYQHYPTCIIEGSKERKRIQNAQAIVLQFPLTWFSPPAIIIEWCDSLFCRSSASDAQALFKGKTFALVTSASCYWDDALLSAEACLDPLKQSASLAGLHWQAPFIVEKSDKITADQVVQRTTEYCTYLRNMR